MSKQQTTRPARTQRVRVLVMIDPTGHWEACGSASFTDDEARTQLNELSGDMGPPPWGYHWVEAELPVPVEEAADAIQGEVSNAG